MKGTLTRLSGELRRMPRVCVKEAGDASLLRTMPLNGTPSGLLTEPGIDEP